MSGELDPYLVVQINVVFKGRRTLYDAQGLTYAR